MSGRGGEGEGVEAERGQARLEAAPPEMARRVGVAS